MVARILVVDDHPPNLLLLEAQLGAAGHEVTTRGDGEAGLRAAAESSFDLVVLDVLMPPPDGIETCARLRRAGCGVPVLFLTAMTDLHTRSRAMEAGGSALLVRPVDRRELVATVARILATAGETPAATDRPVRADS